MAIINTWKWLRASLTANYYIFILELNQFGDFDKIRLIEFFFCVWFIEGN